MSLTQTVDQIRQLYIESGDGLDASSYEVLDLCDAVEVARNENKALKVALEGIRDSSHCAYRDSGPLEDRQYQLGVADGHRCASGMAAAALSACDEGRE